MGFLKHQWIWIIVVGIVLGGAWAISYRVAEPAWDAGHHGRLMAEWPLKAANYVRFGYIMTRFGQVMNHGWGHSQEDLEFLGDHPPLTSLLMSVSFRVFGIHEWSARLVPMLFALGMIPLVFVLVRLVGSALWALVASVFMAASPAFLYFARVTDPYMPAAFFCLAVFVLYYAWFRQRKRWLLIAMWVVFVLGAWTDWVVYFVMPWVLIHYLLFEDRPSLSRPFIVVSALIPFVMFAIFVLWSLWLQGSDWLRLMDWVIRYRTSSASRHGWAYSYSIGDFHRRMYQWMTHYFTPVLIPLSVVWLVTFAVRGIRSRVSSGSFLIFCLFGFQFSFVLVFRNLAYMHEYVLVLPWIPFVSVSAALALRGITHLFKGKWRTITTMILLPLVLWLFATQSVAAVRELHQEGLEPDVYLAGIEINRLVPMDRQVMASFWADFRLRFYADRPFEMATTPDEFEMGLQDPKNTHYVLRPESPDLDPSLRRRLVSEFPVVNFGQYSVFDLRGEGETTLVGDEESLVLSNPVRARFGDELLLLGYDLEPDVVRAKEEAVWWERHFNANADLMPEHNAETRVTYYWKALKALDRDYEVRAQFVADYGDEHVIEETHQLANGALPSSMWREDEVIREAYAIAVPSGEPPLRYALRVAVVDSATGDPLPVADAGEGQMAGGDRIELGDLEVEPIKGPNGTKEVPEVQERLQEDLGDGLVFEGYALTAEGEDARAVLGGQTLDVTTWWLANRPVDEDCPAWVELANGASRVRALLGLEPTRLWEVGKYYTRRAELGLSPYLLPGRYELSLVVGQNPERRIPLEAVEVGWAVGPRWVVHQTGVANGEKGDVSPLDTDRMLRLDFSLDEQMDLEVVTGWTGEAWCEETRVEVYLQNRLGERYLTTWEVPQGEQSITSVQIPYKVTVPGGNSIILRVPEQRPKPHYVGWRAWVDAVFPDLLCDMSGPHDGWIWADYIQVSTDWSEAWAAYRDLARRYSELEMYGEATKLFESALSSGVRPEELGDLNVFLKAFEESSQPEKKPGFEAIVGSLIPHRLDINLEDKVEVLGYSFERTGEGRGHLSLFFRCLETLDGDYTLWLHQYDESGEEFISLDRRLSTSRWKAGWVYEEAWPVELSSEEVRFVFGLWRWEDGSRLWVRDEPEQHEIDLGWVIPSADGVVGR